MVADTSALPVVTPAVDRESAFRELYLAEFRHLSGYVTALVGDQQLGWELAQEAFTRLFARWLGVRDPSAYVFLIATNLVRDHWRKRDRERRVLRHVRDTAITAAPASDPWLWDLVSRLPELKRTVVLLHYYGDLSVEQVAATTGRPVGTVKRQLHEARGLLHSAIEEAR